MRILLTVHQFFPEFRAGTEVLTLSVARQLIRLGHEVHVFTGYPGEDELNDDERFDEYEYENIHVYRFHHAYVPMAGQHSMIEVGYKNLLALKFFKKIIETFRPDVIHYFHLNRLGVELIDYAYNQKIPQYLTPTDFWMICATAQLMLGEGRYCSGPDKVSGNCIKHFARDKMRGMASTLIDMAPTVLFKQLSKITRNQPLISYPMSNEVRALACRTDTNVLLLNKLNAIFVPNDFMESLFLRYGVEERLLINQPFGIEVTPGDSVNTGRKPSRPVTFGFIGTLASHKGCHVLIDAFIRLNHADAVLEIYGNPEEFPDYCQDLYNIASSSEKIVFKGTFPNSEINDVLKRVDALIVPSVWYENTPLVIYSAQAAQVPVIGSRLPGIEAAVKDDFNGLLFEAGNSSDLTVKLAKFIENFEDGKKFEYIEPLSVERYVSRLMQEWSRR